MSHPVLFLLQIARRPGQHNPAPLFLYEIIHPSVGQHSGSCHLFRVSFWPRWPSSLARQTVLTLRCGLYSRLPLSTMSSQLELQFGKGPFERKGEICQIAQYFTAAPGTEPAWPAVMNRASPSSPGRSLAWDKSLPSQALSNWSTRGERVKNVTGEKDHRRSFSEKCTRQQVTSFFWMLRNKPERDCGWFEEHQASKERSCCVLHSFLSGEGEHGSLLDGLTGIKIIKSSKRN